MDTDQQPETITEAALAEEIGVPRDVLVRLRKSLPLVMGEDFAPVPQRGITLTVSGVSKIKGALPAPPVSESPKKEAPPAPVATVSVEVRQASGNGRTCLCRIVGLAEAHRAFVAPSHRLKATTLRPGLVLHGCTFINPELLTYDGPVPSRPGQPMPEKKEGAL